MKSEMLAWIEEQEPELVQAAESYIGKYEIHQPSPQGRGPRNKARVSASQLRNLLAAAQARSSLAVLVNFLRYQIGRGRQGWADATSGRALIELLEKEVGKRIKDGGAASGRERYLLESRLAALLIGFLIREYTFRCRIAGTSSYD